jgi:hypothetical protein
MMKKFVWGAMALAALLLFNNRALAASASQVQDDLDTYKDEVNSGVGVLSSRLGEAEKALGLKLSGDVRFRWDYMAQNQDRKPTGVAALAIQDRGRFRFRLRFGAVRDFGSAVSAGLRLASGSTAEPTSTNQTLGGEGTEKFIGIDLAYIKWAPSVFQNYVSVTAGKIPNPLTFSPITWDGDTNPEGAALGITAPSGTSLKGLYFALEENSANPEPYLLNCQLEQSLKAGGVDIGLMIGYEYVPYISAYLKTPPAAYTDPGAGTAKWYVDDKGMVANRADRGLIPDIQMIEGMVKVGHNIGSVPFNWMFHLADNLNSFNLTAATNANVAVNNPTSDRSNSVALFAKLGIGKIANPGEFEGSIEWGYIEPNAVFSLFSDSDSGNGGNNNTWFKGVVTVGLENGLNFSLTQYVDWLANYDVKATAPSNKMGDTSQQPIWRSQVDMVVKL